MKILLIICSIYTILLAGLNSAELKIQAQCDSFRNSYNIVLTNEIYEFDYINITYQLRTNNSDIIEFQVSENIQPKYHINKDIKTPLSSPPILLDGKKAFFNVSNENHYSNVVRMDVFTKLISEPELFFYLKGKNTSEILKIMNHRQEWIDATTACEEQKFNKRNNHYLGIAAKVVGVLLALGLLVFSIISILNIMEKIALIIKQKSKDGTTEVLDYLHQMKVKKIKEEESIRKNIQQPDEEIEVLQKLIYEAIDNEDLETAQSLLKVLKEKKGKK